MPRERWNRDERGAVAVLVAVGALAFVLLAGLVVDFGFVFAKRAHLQSVVDAAALAGAQEFCTAAGDPQARAVEYATLNGLTTTPVVSVQTGGSSYITVDASEPVSLVFGGLVGGAGEVGNAAVGATGTAVRQCFINFQFVADTTVQFNGAGSEGGNWYAGECFDGQNNAFDTIAVGTPVTHMCSDPNINGDPPPIVRSDADRKLYDVGNISSAGAMAGSPLGPYVEGGSLDPWTNGSVVIGSCADVTWSSAPTICNGSLTGTNKVPAGVVNADVIIASGDIDLTNNLDFRGRLIYSRTGDITLLNGVPEGVIIYAPHGAVVFNGSGTRNDGMIFAESILFNGGDQDAGQGVDLYAPGAIALAR